MGLSYDFTKATRIPRETEPNEEGHFPVTKEFWPVLDSAIWGMLTTGVGWELTDENAALYYARYKVAALLGGYTPLTPEQVHTMVGLHTNTSPETDTKWRKRILEFSEREYKAQYNRFVAELEAANEAKHEEDVERSIAEHERQIAEEE